MDAIDAKTQAEIRKLEAETNQILYPWWKRSTYVASVASVVVTVLVFLWGLMTGYFDDARSAIEKEKQSLERQSEQLKLEVRHLQLQERQYKQELADAEQTFELATIRHNGVSRSLASDISRMETERRKLTNERDSLLRVNQISRSTQAVVQSVAEVGGAVNVSVGNTANAYRISLMESDLELEQDHVNPLLPTNQQISLNYAGRRKQVDEILVRLRRLPNVRELYIDTDRYAATGLGLQQVAHLSELERLGFRGGGFNDGAVSFLGVLPKVKVLELDGCQITNDGWFNLLESCPNIERIVTQGVPINRDVLALIGRTKSLRSVAIVANEQLSIQPLLSLPSLRGLEIDCFAISDFSDTSLTPLKSLEMLTIGVESDEQLIRIGELTSLSKLAFNWARNVTSTGLDGLGNLSNLTELTLDCSYGDNQAFSFLSRLLQLERLHLTHAKLSRSDFEIIGGLRRLKDLNLHGATIDDDDLIKLSNLEELESLDLGQVHLQTYADAHPAVNFDEGIRSLRRLPNLTHLVLSGCGITDAGAMSLCQLSSLKRLWVDSTGLSNEAVTHLRESLPNTTIYYTVNPN